MSNYSSSNIKHSLVTVSFSFKGWLGTYLMCLITLEKPKLSEIHIKLELSLAGLAEMTNTLFCSREILHLVSVIQHNRD